MKPDELVATFPTSIRLKEAGFLQQTFFWWERHGTGWYLTWPDPQEGVAIMRVDGWIAAPTLAEVLDHEGFVVLLNWIDTERVLLHENPAEAAALLWLSVHANDTGSLRLRGVMP